MTTAIEQAPVVLPALMTEEQAREVAGRIRRGIGELRQLLVEFKEREGWRALGYANLDECCRAEFNIGRSHLYRQLTAGAIEKNIGSPLGTERESHLRPLAGKPREVQRQAFAEAKRDGAPTAEKVRRAVERIETPAPEPKPDATETPLERSLRIAREIQALRQPEPEPLVSGSVAIEGQTVTIDTPTPVSEASELVNQRIEKARADIDEPADDLGEIESAVLKRNKMSVGRAAGLFSQILAAAEQGGASWESRLKGACRASFK